MTPYLYFARPVDQAPASSVEELRNHAEELAVRGLLPLVFAVRQALQDPVVKAVVFEPAEAWTLHGNPHPDGTLQLANLAVLDLCSHVVAVLPAGVATVGVPLEVQFALDRDKRVLVLTDHSSSWVTAKWAEDGALVLDASQYTQGQLEKEVVEWFCGPFEL
ncbi:deoxyuridine triphosphatase [Gordonia phage Ghobes]|uniref:Deoxyuridine triphosphatase n=1 Tax=Gordonia phage Ghobes TaxID=1887647 RepID=A0A1B3B077_9CAUD|nr:deoxyuridine triphosphatase [Gordonia phage Ghobes]AOE44404.1 deoxyuridine triphosphatase [Gordonia phage Ghobes]